MRAARLSTPASAGRQPRLRWVLVGALSALSAACSAEADIPRVIFEHSGLRFDGASALPFDIGSLQESRRIEVDFDHPGDLDGLPVEVELYATQARIVARSGAGDLSFIEGIELRVASRSEGAPEPRPLATYRKPDGSAPVDEVALATSSETNVFDYWETEEPYYRISAWGTLPQEDWTVDVVVEFRGNLRLQ